jgi:tRNA U55 pseudouridine synthase TruB
MTEKVLNLYKNPGETPLERLDRFRGEHLEYKDEKLSYVGRLDPLAEGVMLVVIGDENQNR